MTLLLKIWLIHHLICNRAVIYWKSNQSKPIWIKNLQKILNKLNRPHRDKSIHIKITKPWIEKTEWKTFMQRVKAKQLSSQNKRNKIRIIQKKIIMRILSFNCCSKCKELISSPFANRGSLITRRECRSIFQLKRRYFHRQQIRCC